MKNGYVTSDHHGDDGTVREGMILRDLSEQRLASLEKAGLAREATAAEVKAGYKPAISTDESKVAEEPQNKKAPEPANKAR